MKKRSETEPPDIIVITKSNRRDNFMIQNGSCFAVGVCEKWPLFLVAFTVSYAVLNDSAFTYCCLSLYSVIKLVGLLFQTLAKPVAKRIKVEFSRNEVTRRVLIGLGQTAHHVTSRLTIWSAGFKVRSIALLEEEKAISLGADLVSETFLLTVSGTFLILEYNRSKAGERKKNEQHRAKVSAEAQALQAKLNTLDVRVKALEAVVKRNSESILNLGRAKYVAPQNLVPIDNSGANDSNYKE